MGKFNHIDIEVISEFINKLASRYVELRTKLLNYPENNKVITSLDCGFDVTNLLKRLKKYSVAIDSKREQGAIPPIVSDIYRSDLGELLTTEYYEEILAEGSRYIIPLKNISYRERDDMPGKGIDAIGYRIIDDKIDLLAAEAKVSEQSSNPPDVVHTSKDSLYKTQLKYHNDQELLIKRVQDFMRRLGGEHLIIMAALVASMESGDTDKYSITYGCCLVRDYTCVDFTKDYGKLKSNEDDFTNGDIHAVILSFTDKTINETVDLFYKKVQEIVNE